MALRELAAGLLMAAAASPLAATVHERAPGAGAPAGTAETRYCLRFERTVGTLLEQVQCSTRAEWEAQGIDLDKEWANAGVRVEEPLGRSAT